MTRGRLARAVVDDRGVATVFGACVIAGLVALVIAMIYLGSAVVARHRAQSAADLAALAAAQRVMLALDDPCGAARDIAGTSHVSVARCRTDGDDVIVTVTVPVQLGPFGVRDARAVARAGPTDQPTASAARRSIVPARLIRGRSGTDTDILGSGGDGKHVIPLA